MRLGILVLVLAMLAVACGGSSTSGDSPGAAAGGPTRPLALTDPGSTPALDRTRAEVELGRVVFDTFNGGSVALDRADEELVERLFDAIEPIDAPDYETADVASEWLGPDDVIIGYVDPQGGAWAYAIRVLNFHEIVNDELGGQPVLISYCPLCASGVVYDRHLDGRLLSFSNTSALFENDLVMVDRETGSYWWQVPGRAIVGELTGSTLEPLVAETTTWERWLGAQPDTMVMARPVGRDYSRDPFANYAASVDAGLTPFPVDPAALNDPRLTPATRVVVAEVAGSFRAWSVEEPRTVSDEVDGVSLVVTTDGVGGRVEADGEPLPVLTTLWFAAVAAYPDVTLGP